jgi:hypothetical protein
MISTAEDRHARRDLRNQAFYNLQPATALLYKREPAGRDLDTAALWGTAPVMGNRRHISDRDDADSSRLQSTNSCLTAGSRALHIDFDLAHSMIHRLACGRLGRHLGGIWSALSRSLEIGGAGAAPRQHISIGIRDGHQSIVECRLNVCSPARHRLPLSLALAPYRPLRSFLRHADWFPFPDLRHQGTQDDRAVSPALLLRRLLLAGHCLLCPTAGARIGSGTLPMYR